MNKFYNTRHSTEGNRWMLLESKAAKVVVPGKFAVGSELELSRNAVYIIQKDNSLRRKNRTPRQKRGITFSGNEPRRTEVAV